MAGGHGHGHGVTYKGVTIHQPKRWHTVTGKGLCAVILLFFFNNGTSNLVLKRIPDFLFWVLYRAKQDGPVVLGWRHPWEGHDDHH
ncbi:hypothetical protein ACJIZ3_024735 [Penstemon smallii]|uniref:Transmembrane protein n=1 Tax=Penstemon smallii TaxID=265156 RepID=A0ABD3TSP9_9LAMI